MPDLSALNSRQYEAVQQVNGPVLVLAGAGSGKTRVITYKIAHLIREHGIAARHIAAVTFTNKAAREMNQRVRQLLGGREARGLRISTFHTLGLNIIRQEQSLLGYRSGFSIMDGQDAVGIVRELIHADLTTDPALAEKVHHQVSAWKNRLYAPDQTPPADDNPIAQAAAKIYPLYNRQL
ncbi:MAG: ATP-dependent DNA helicase Rep, partial [Gammaproteobacteria bacterium]